MGKLLILLLLLLAAFLALGIWLYNTFGLWGFLGALAVFALGVYSFKFLFVWGLRNLFLMPFKAKGAVMKDAALEVHSVVATDAPPVETYPQIEGDEYEQFEDEDEEEEDSRESAAAASENGNPYRVKGAPVSSSDEDEEEEDDAYDEDEPRDWYLLEATITPQPPRGAFRMWEPGELTLVEPNAKRNDLDVEDVGSVADLEIWVDGQWREDEGYKYEGPQRLKMRVGVRRGTRTARFKYYFEVFGDEIAFPAPIDV